MSQLRVDEIRANDGLETTEVSIPGLDQRFAKAWINFDGEGTPNIRDSYNVDSITDVGVGRYIINFSNNMPNTNYAVVASSRAGVFAPFGGNQTVSSVEVGTYLGLNPTNLVDTSHVALAIFSN